MHILHTFMNTTPFDTSVCIRNEEVSPVTVSYTHLDVYKRQELLAAAILDMNLHNLTDTEDLDVVAYEKEAVGYELLNQKFRHGVFHGKILRSIVLLRHRQMIFLPHDRAQMCIRDRPQGLHRWSRG